jgi:3-oxoacyl-[acyl-carrier protein] reductase
MPWDAIMDINAKAVFFATQAVLPTMIEHKRGVIVSLASMAGKIGSRANLPYNASKAAVISMTKSLAVAHAADGRHLPERSRGHGRADARRVWSD